MGQIGVIAGGIALLLLVVWIFRHKHIPTLPASQPPGRTPAIPKKDKFAASLPRRRYWRSDIQSPHLCPECQQPVEQEFHSYLLFLKRGRDVDSFLVGNDGGYFCATCPVVVLDEEAFRKSSQVVMGNASEAFFVAGLVDFDAIPEEKRELPLGDDDNPIPLVEFLNTSTAKKTYRTRPRVTRKQRKALRNQKRRKGKRK